MGKLINEITYILICLHLFALSREAELVLSLYPDADRSTIVEFVGVSMILVVLFNLLFHIGALVVDIMEAASTLAKNYPLVVEPLYEMVSPNAYDPEDSEDDLCSEPEESPDHDYDHPGIHINFPTHDPEKIADFPQFRDFGPSLPKKVSVPKPRFVFDVKLPKVLKDAIDLALPAVPEKPKI